MENIYKIKEDLYYIGASDRKIQLFESLQKLTYGMAYNSYVYLDKKTCLLDTSDHAVSDEFLENLDFVLNGKSLDYVVVQHMEPDHAFCLKEVILRHPETTLVINAQILKMINNFFRDIDTSKLKLLIVKDGDKLELGNNTLQFVFAPMVHWPEVMLAYEINTKTLFSADAFGSYGALNGKIYFDEYDFEKEFLDEARRYYMNIVSKYGNPVQSLFKKVEGVPFDLILPLHGVLFRKPNDIQYIIRKYDTWSSYEPEEKGVLIVYGSIYGNTAKAANILAKTLSNAGVKNIFVRDSSIVDNSFLLSDAFKYSHLIVLSSSYNAGVFPKIEEFMLSLKAHNYQNRKVAFIENGSWAPSAYNSVKDILNSFANTKLYDKKITILSTLSRDNLSQFDDLVSFIKEDFKEVDLNSINTSFNIPYGLYLCCSAKEDNSRVNGCIINTFTQISDPNIYSVSLNRTNYTTKLILQSKKIIVSVLNQDTPMDLIKRFGFQSGAEGINKFEGFNDFEIDKESNLPYISSKYSNSYFVGEVINHVELEEHVVIYFKLTQTKALNNSKTLTYSYYQSNIKPVNKSKGTNIGWRCKICGYLYKGENLPKDFVCPWCKHGPNDFEKVLY